MCGFQGEAADVRLPEAVLVGNYFCGGCFDTCLLINGTFGNIVVRKNVLEQSSRMSISIQDVDASGEVELANNTLADGSLAVISKTGRFPANLAIRNNLFAGPIRCLRVRKPVLPSEARQWRLGPNVVPCPPEGDDGLVRRHEDLISAPEYLSIEPADRNYLRLPADSIASAAGAGGAWTRYLGALPPGPPPEAGDWFTRLQARRLAAMKPGPAPTLDAGKSRVDSTAAQGGLFALEFDGIDDYAQLAKPELQVAAPFTLEAVIEIDEPTHHLAMIMTAGGAVLKIRGTRLALSSVASRSRRRS
jgi:hypothetical protein